ncbi:MAG TPA: CRISPR-associated endoribonuclease Cas6 [Bacteroidota bacterium]|nr:CRISPR-associated endoribonuclease Cas6 [Bacteroidota bacterium]
MRLAIDYEMSGEYLPRDYRSGFMALIKKALEITNPVLLERYYSSRTLKPFTFSTYFAQLKGTEGEKLNVGKEVRLNFSTPSLELASYVYNGLRATRAFPLFEQKLGFENTLKLKRIAMQRAERIRSSEVIFKTASPVLVNNIGRSDWYLLPGESGFEEGLHFAVSEIAKEFLDWQIEVPLEFNGRISVKRRVVSHYNQNMSAFVGTFLLKSDPKILQLIYDVGLGVRRSQGFGMLEVVKQ